MPQSDPQHCRTSKQGPVILRDLDAAASVRKRSAAPSIAGHASIQRTAVTLTRANIKAGTVSPSVIAGIIKNPSACAANAKPFIAAEIAQRAGNCERRIARHGGPPVGRRGKHGELKRDEAQINAYRHKPAVRRPGPCGRPGAINSMQQGPGDRQNAGGGKARIIIFWRLGILFLAVGLISVTFR
jgi:hypothetical protein